MPNPHGSFIWYELLTPDADAAQHFYGGLLGWDFADSGQPGMDYRIISAGLEGIGGIMPISSSMAASGVRPIWLGYIAVDDVDAAVSAITAAGGAVHMPATDMDGVGRIAMVAGLDGAPFYVMRPVPSADNPDAVSLAFAYDKPRIGHCAWNELSSSNPETALDFFTGLFGWKQVDAMDMGPLGTYHIIGNAAGNVGAIMPKLPEMPGSAWLFYMRVPDIDAAVAAIKAGGGTLLDGPTEIPGGDYSLAAKDPGGASFGLVGARK